MATVAVYDPSQANRLISVGDDPGSVPAPYLKTPTAFSDGTLSGSPVDFGHYTWQPASLIFALTPPPVPTANQIAIDALLAQSPTTWTVANLAQALQFILRMIRAQV